MNIASLFGFNKFAKFFVGARKEEEHQEKEEMDNSVGISQEEIDAARTMSTANSNSYQYTGGLTYIGIQFEQYFSNKAARIVKYREMSFFPEIADSIYAICDEAIVDNPVDGDIVKLDINVEMPEHIEEEVRKIWEYLSNDVFSFNERAWDLFKKWLVEAELYVELILNDEGDNIIGIKILPAYTMMPIYEENKIRGYVQSKTPAAANTPTREAGEQQQHNTVFDKDQVSYINYGLYGHNFYDVRGFLESSIRTYNQLRNLEDSLVIYRLVRAPERKIWNIAVGRMPKGKAEEYIRGMIQRYKKRIVYDSETGAMNSAQNIQALTEDFWFAKNDRGEGTSVETIGGTMNLGEIEDVNYFLKKLYKGLKLPKSRWEDPASSMYSAGKSGEIQREEIKFARFVERLQRRFKYVILEPFLTLLRLRGIDERYIGDGIYNLSFNKANLFKEYKELELNEAKFGLLGSIDSYVYKPGENDSGFFSREFVMRKYFQLSDEEWNENIEMVNAERAQAQSEGETGGEGEAGGGFGEEEFGGFGGGEIGGGGEFGGGGGTEPTPETPEAPPAETPAETAPETAPESVQYKKGYLKKKDTNKKNRGDGLVSSWKQEDKTIREKYNHGDRIISKK